MNALEPRTATFVLRTVGILVTAISFHNTAMSAELEDKALTKTLAEILPNFDDDDKRNDAILALTKIGEVNGSKAVAIVSKWIDHTDKKLSKNAVYALGVLGRSEHDAIPILENAIHHKDTNVVKAAMESLAYIGPRAVESVPKLIEVYKNNAEWGLQVAETIRLIGSGSVPALVSALREENRLLRNFCLFVFSSMAIDPVNAPSVGPDAKAVIPILIKMINNKNERLPLLPFDKDDDDKTCMAAVQILGYIGTDAKDAIPTLKGLSESGNSLLRKYAKDAIDKINIKKTDK